MRTLMLLLLLLCLIGCRNSPNEATSSQTKTARSWSLEDTRSITGFFAKRGLIKNELLSGDYLLFHPSAGTATYLMNRSGQILHQWSSELNCMQSHLKVDGNLVRLERDPDFPVFAAGGQAGRLREYTWDGEMIWDFEYASDKFLTHHDFVIKPNGNILAIAYEVKTPEEAVAAGRDPNHIAPAGLWPDKIIEIQPIYPTGGNIVWEWKMWDHLIQDLDPSKVNYGELAAYPRKININVFDPHGPPPPPAEQIQQMIKGGIITANANVDNWHSDITHTNAINYNADLEQIALSVPGYCEIWIVDQSTSTNEAATDEGGRWGHGGELLYRWGNPRNYGRGGPQDQVLYYQHDVRWIPDGTPGSGNLLVFNNDIPSGENKLPGAFAAVMGAGSPDPQVSIADVGNYSAVHEIIPPTEADGSYSLPADEAFGPSIPNWTYTAVDTFSFYSPFVSGATRLSSGHLLICSGAQGRFFQVNQEGEIVWEYWNPYFHDYKLPDGTAAQPVGPFKFAQFRVSHYSESHPAMAGRSLAALDPQPTPFVPELPEQ
ncbi:MAG: aryl-sulfate sulfotransferase [Saprospiraceae bacterium]|nr:aryl-sulfate sulfotransferase [Saprospiraceae bacterium]